MLYNINFDIGALALYMFMLVMMMYKKGMGKLQNKIFLIVVFDGIVATTFDILTVIGDGSVTSSELTVKSLYNYGYLITHNLMPFIFGMYVLVASGYYLKRGKLFYLVYSIPCLLSIITISLNPVFKWVFTYSESGSYVRGTIMPFLYMSAVAYLVLSLFCILTNRYAIAIGRIVTLLVFAVLTVGAIIFQMYHQYVLVELFVQGLAFLGIMFTMDDEDEMRNGITSIYNRKAFLNENAMIINCRVNYSVISIQITNYQYYASVLGVTTMNNVMKDVAKWLDSTTNRGVYDLSKGLFSIIMLNTNDRKNHEFVDKLYEKFQSDWKYEDIYIAFKTQICIVNLPYDVNTLDGLLILTETRYATKDEKVAIVEGEQLDFIKRESEVEAAVQRALANKSFDLYYQPIWDSKSNTIHSAEALIRLFDYDLGDIPPEEFIPITEKNGTIVEIGTKVFEQVCRDISSINLEDFGLDFIEVNLSTVQCMTRDIATEFKRIMDKYHVDPKQINLEITESAAINSTERFLDTLDALKELGFTFSMDDYGTGYSNFSYMFDMDFDIIKLDKSILWNAESEQGRIMLKNTVKMIKEMNHDIVMEGVETEEQKNYVAELGCDYCQGFYFSKPISFNAFLEYVKKFNHK